MEMERTLFIEAMSAADDVTSVFLLMGFNNVSSEH